MRLLLKTVILFLLMVSQNAYSKEIYLSKCDFIIGMPSNVKIEKINSTYFSYDQAKSSVGEVFLQAECLPYSAQEKEVKQMVFAHENSVGGYGASFKRIELNKYESRFYKKIEGVGTATFLTHIYVGRNSTLIAIGGVTSNKFPNEEITKFHKSIKFRWALLYFYVKVQSSEEFKY